MKPPARFPLGAAPILAPLLFLAIVPAARAQTQTWVPGKGHGSATVAQQQLYIDTHTGSHGETGFPGTITTNSTFLSFDYGITDRLAIDFSLPWKSSKFEGPGKHDPDSLDDDHGQQLIDDGDYHGGWQDMRVGLRYLLPYEPLRIVPFIAYGAPTHDYVTFAHATLGTGQNHLQVGVNVGRQFGPIPHNWFFQAGIAHSFMEKLEDRRVDHTTFALEVGYFFSPRLSASVLWTEQKTWNGFEISYDYPNFHDDHWFHHDQNLRNDFINIGAAVNFQVNDRYSTFLTYGHTLWGENTHLIDYAVTIGVSRGF